MVTWFIMLGSNLLYPMLMLIAARLFIKGAPKNINSLYGYRTTMSMKNQDTWQFAHAVAGKFWFRWSWVSLVIAIVPMLFTLGQSEDTICTVGLVLTVVLLIPLVAVIPHTETALRRTFDEDGYRR